ncbi:hypothetical protein B484DRAFT_444798 [Ochromonadaceae sp. CCMP2298]|nr:hypothetical protein B484DRAFT_444798 [Ochromonadaceae sp. CCMP2298]
MNKASQSRHNLFSNVDHDRQYIDKNIKLQRQDSANELPALNLDIRKQLAANQLSFKIKSRTPVITAASHMGADDNADKFVSAFGLEHAYNDDSASVVSNNSHALDLVKRDATHQLEDFMDELGKVGHVSDESSDSDSDSDEGYGTFVEKDRNKYASALDVHRQFMAKATQKNTLREIQSVGAIRSIAKLKAIAKKAQGAALLPDTGSELVTPKKKGKLAAFVGSGSFLFLSKLSADKKDKPSSPLRDAQDSPSSSGSLTPPKRPANYSAGPGGSTYSVKNIGQDGSPSNGMLPLFGRKEKAKQIAHSASSFSLKTLNTLNNHFDTAGSALSATRGAGVSRAAPSGPTVEGAADGVYHVPALKRAHEDGKAKNLLGRLDDLFINFTFMKKEEIPLPEVSLAPKPLLSMQTLFPDQMMKSHIADRDRISDLQMEAMWETSQAEDLKFAKRKKEVDVSSPEAVARNMDLQLRKMQREELVKKATEAMALLDQKPTERGFSVPLPLHAHGGSKNHVLPPDLDLRRVSQGGVLSPSLLSPITAGDAGEDAWAGADTGAGVGAGAWAGGDAYDISVHALGKLPSLYGTSSPSTVRSQEAPILCIYSPAPQEYTGMGHVGHKRHVGQGHQSHQGHHDYPGHHDYQGHQEQGHPEHGGLVQLQGLSQGTKTLSRIPSADPGAMVFISTQSLAAQLSTDKHGKPGAGTGAGAGAGVGPLYKAALHSQTQSYLSRLENSDPDFHSDPRNYLSPTADLPLYNFDLELDDAAREPLGDGGYPVDSVDDKTLLPANAWEGAALLDMGYVYQHSTNSYTHRELGNRSRFGQHQRSDTADPLQDDFSDRALEGIINSSVGVGAPVIYIPPGKPAAEPEAGESGMGGGSGGGDAGVSGLFSRLSSKVFSRGKEPPSTSQAQGQGQGHGRPMVPAKSHLSAGEVLSDESYARVRSIMRHPGQDATNSIHYNTNTRRIKEEGDSFRDAPSLSALEAESQEEAVDVQQEIVEYIARMSSGGSPLKPTGDGGGVRSPGGGAGGRGVSSSASVSSTDEQSAAQARLKLWGKLNQRYAGDKEGIFNAKKEIKEHIYKGIRENTHIMNEYNMEDWD